MEDIGKGAYAMIAELVTALNVDYDRLEELLDREGLSNDERGELMMLRIVAGECKSRDDALERIQQDALCVEVRSLWVPVGYTMTVDQFAILISTGGPAVRIRGDLVDGVPCRAWLETQDWVTPWTQYSGASQDVLLDYARCFHFGD
jgi:hypothetical protein